MDIFKLEFTVLESKILSYLCLRAGKKFTQRELAEVLDVSPTAVGKSLNKLENLIIIEKTRTSNLISLNTSFREVILYKRNQNLSWLFRSGLFTFLETQLAGSTIILFGSFSTGEDIHTSDIDLAVIGRKPKELELEKYERILHHKININYYESWDMIHKHLRNNILNGIVLSGGVEL
jgi:predicted nucleotidyltransferase/DNA-binding XRE family transcriptional regulator